MKFILTLLNTPTNEHYHDQMFASLDDLLAYVHDTGLIWTSLVVTILPDPSD